MSWTDKTAVWNGSKTNNGSSMVYYMGKVYLIYVESSNAILEQDFACWSSYDANGWSRPAMICQCAGRAPALAVFERGVMYAMINEKDDNWYLHQYLLGENTWCRLSTFQPALQSDSALSIFEHQRKLFCAFANSNTLYYKMWDPDAMYTFVQAANVIADGWGQASQINGELTWGVPALYQLNDKLYVVFTSNNDDRKLLTCFYDSKVDGWLRSDSTLKEASAYGVSAFTTTDRAYIVFQQNDGSGHIIATWTSDNKTWNRLEDIVQYSDNTPCISAIGNTINVVFDSHASDNSVFYVQSRIGGRKRQTWMRDIPPDQLVSDMSIPGTHDSAAFWLGPSWNSVLPFVCTQSLNIPSQLAAGIRYFDLRLGLGDDKILYLYHASFKLWIKFDQVIDMFNAFLTSNSTEGLLVQIKCDFGDSGQAFSDAVAQSIDRIPGIWLTSNTTPKMGNLRGKIQLVRRFAYIPSKPNTNFYGIDVWGKWVNNQYVSAWPQNTAEFFTNINGINFHIQDQYEYENADPLGYEDAVKMKESRVEQLFKPAEGLQTPGDWYINYTSFSGNFQGDTPVLYTPFIYAGGYDDPVTPGVPPNIVSTVRIEGINARVRAYVYSKSTTSVRRLGMVVMDYPEQQPDLIIGIINTNFGA